MRMDPILRIVTILPLTELWDERGTLTFERGPQLGRDDIASRLRAGETRFILADVGESLKWIPSSEAFRLWKEEVRPRLVEPGLSFHLDDYPGSYCYLASEWMTVAGEVVVVLERCH